MRVVDQSAVVPQSLSRGVNVRHINFAKFVPDLTEGCVLSNVRDVRPPISHMTLDARHW